MTEKKLIKGLKKGNINCYENLIDTVSTFGPAEHVPYSCPLDN